MSYICQITVGSTSAFINVRSALKFLVEAKLRQRIVEAVAAIDRQMLQRVWQELDYKMDICRVTKGGYIEHL
jgi:hypothetical protein